MREVKDDCKFLTLATRKMEFSLIERGKPGGAGLAGVGWGCAINSLVLDQGSLR